MRLERIKLAGFKSFVDPTTVPLPGNLVGIVGPNGCGKSNVIDAVRWVMGESSAKLLRGESMADVIFNGSTGRQPVSVASIELVFDNADGRAGGEFAAFSQIAVKRQVTRDGQSVYSLNGTRCRRRDIQDLFLGTGLGPRSYAIIEQGMISRLIEARPEDLRLFLEEAAGISKYKERRRETESRMRRTQENLERLNDLREELDKQLKRLKSQAQVAERFGALKAEEQRLEQELQALHWRTLDDELRQLEQQLQEAETIAAAVLARQCALEADIERQRTEHQQAGDEFNRVQGQFYAVAAEISRCEQAIRFANEERGRGEAELMRVERALDEAVERVRQDQSRLDELSRELARDQPALVACERELAQVADTLAAREMALTQWETDWDACNQAAAQPAGEAQAARARLTALEQRQVRDGQRRQRLEEDIGRLQLHDGDCAQAALQARLAERAQTLDDVARRLAGARARGEVHETELAELGSVLDTLRTERQQTEGRLASLEALQEAALRDGDAATTQWLAAHGLADAPRLADQMQVAEGWGAAVEALLGERLRMVAVTNLADLALDAALPEAVGFIETAANVPALPAAGRLDGDSHDPGCSGLIDQVSSSWPVHELLQGVRIAGSVEEALARRVELRPDERFVTAAGIEVARHWLRLPGSPEHAGVFDRASEIAAARTLLDELGGREASLRAQIEQAHSARTEAQTEARELLAQQAELQREHAALQVELRGEQARAEQRRERLAELHEEHAELAEQTAETEAELVELRSRLHAHLDELERASARRDALSGQRERLRATVAESRAGEHRAREQVQQLQLAIQTNQTASAALAEGLARLRSQHDELGIRRAELNESLADAVEPLAEQRERLAEQLQMRVETEASLNAARAHLEALDQAIRECEHQRQQTEHQATAYREALAAQRLAHQERAVRRATWAEQLAAQELSPAAVLEALEPDATAAVWQQRLERVGASIRRLGAINLAAIEEFREQSERKQYLDAQHDDISRALDTLREAIRRIDRETRTRFRETYERVDQGFRQLFPRLFGGGRAALELTGEDLLETGVSVMACPPGKRNSTIHLLSGGEKALTAIALVFAIFELNPAPFCMLDEVDAPLDDANVGRYCELVRAMSQHVQFIFISHNKVAMEMADHLLGVTMHEPGCSRLVSVDVEEAARLAAVA